MSTALLLDLQSRAFSFLLGGFLSFGGVWVFLLSYFGHVSCCCYWLKIISTSTV